MAWSSSVAALAAAAVTVLAPRPAAADTATRGEPCDGGTVASIMAFRYGVEPTPEDRLGLDLLVRSIEIGWGGGCDVRRHTFQLTEAEAADFGRTDQMTIRFGTYRFGWQGDGWTAYVGLHGVVLWGERVRFATPVVGGSLTVGRTLLRADLDLGGLSFFDGDARLGRRRTDLTVEASAAWPDHARTRAEVRVRVRDLNMVSTDGAADVDDLTVTAGVGLAPAARDHLRALPGFVGIATRPDERAALVVLEWNLGVGTR